MTSLSLVVGLFRLVVMSEAPEQRDVDALLTVFDGSSPEDASHARRLWSSLSLLPPQESRLVSADIRQRLPVSRPQRSGSSRTPGGLLTGPAPGPGVQVQEERERYRAQAEQRREILALLQRQRELRIRKELVSEAVKPARRVRRPQEEEEIRRDRELVRQLQ